MENLVTSAFRFDFGDGYGAETVFGEGVAVNHSYTKTGTYTVTVTAVGPGHPPKTTTIDATVIVEPGPLDYINLDPGDASVQATDGQQFNAGAFDRFGNPIPGLTYVFYGMEEAGRIDVDGYFTAGTKPGSYPGAITVEVTQGSITQRARVDILTRAGPPQHLSIVSSQQVMMVGTKQKFVGVVTDGYGNSLPDVVLRWTIEPGGGIINSQGVFSAGMLPGRNNLRASPSAVDSISVHFTVDVVPGEAGRYRAKACRVFLNLFGAQ